MPKKTLARCAWAGDELIYVAYHDQEWGVPERDDRALFEKLILDGFQAGLSWITILKKRENFRTAFDGFEPERIARYSTKKIESLMNDAGIVRNRAKIEGTVVNAKGYLRILEERGSFAELIWDATGGATKQNRWTSIGQIPAESEESRALSKVLKGYGFTFVGPTIVYAFMQAIGMVNDHLVSCFRHAPLASSRATRRSRSSR